MMVVLYPLNILEMILSKHIEIVKEDLVHDGRNVTLKYFGDDLVKYSWDCLEVEYHNIGT